MKTIKQISDEIGVSKQAIQKRISREPLHTYIYPYISTRKGTKYIDSKGEKIIKSAFNNNREIAMSIDKDTEVADNQQPNVHSDVYGNVNSEIIKLIQENLFNLQKQLEIKDSQIIELNERLKESQELNKNNQILLASEQNKIKTNTPLLIEDSIELNQNKKSYIKKKNWQFWKN